MSTSRSPVNKKRKIDIEESSQTINTSKSYTNMKKRWNTTNQTEINTCYVIKLSPDAIMPKSMSKHSSGLSVLSPSAREIAPKMSVKIHLGYRIRIPLGTYASIVNTPDLAKKGITTINFCFERDFEEELVITLSNTSDDETYIVKPGDVVGQIIFSEIFRKPKLKLLANFPELTDIYIANSITTFYL